MEYLGSVLDKRESETVARLVVAMLVVCERMENELNRCEGIRKILDFCFASTATSKDFYRLFWQDVKVRLEAGDLGEDMLVQLGSHISSLAYKEKKLPVVEYMEE